MTLSPILDDSTNNSEQDQADINETHIWGPPGCGKTTYIGRQVANAVERYGGGAVLVTSFTKAAATELAMRGLPLPPNNVGTLHSHCYRALDHPVIAEGEIPDWNRHHPEFRLSITTDDVDEMEPEYTGHTHGDQLYGKLQIIRARMEPEDRWPAVVRRFATAWEAWKRENGLMDFTDLLEKALRDFKVGPDNPKVVVVDEAQDLSRLQLAVVRQWGQHADHLLLAGDDDQAILTFAGSDPEALLETDGPEYFRFVLSQSYRVPRAIHALSQVWVQKLTTREPKEYRPRDHDGEIRLLRKGTYKYPEPIVDDAEQQLSRGKTVMFLAPCSYMVDPLKQVLRRRGLPFHNPYRRKRFDWNPLELRQHGASAADRLLSFLKPRPDGRDAPWSGEDLRRWALWLQAESILRDGAIESIKKFSPTDVVTMETLIQLFEFDALEELVGVVSERPFTECIEWWLAHVTTKKRKQAEYSARVALRHGIKALTDRPRIIVGTGHSVKGGEADLVYICPDLSPAGMQQWEGPRKGRDAVIRLGYVMITRARESLVICEPAGSDYMPLANFVAKGRRAASMQKAETAAHIVGPQP